LVFISDENNKGMSSLRPPENFSGVSEPAAVITIDEWVKKERIRKIDIIKLDVEGSELFALQGMIQTLMNFKPILIVEINANTLGYFGLSPIDVMTFLSEVGYSVFNLDENGRLQKASHENWTENVACIHVERAEQLQSYSLK